MSYTCGNCNRYILGACSYYHIRRDPGELSCAVWMSRSPLVSSSAGEGPSVSQLATALYRATHEAEIKRRAERPEHEGRVARIMQELDLAGAARARELAGKVWDYLQQGRR